MEVLLSTGPTPSSFFTSMVTAYKMYFFLSFLVFSGFAFHVKSWGHPYIFFLLLLVLVNVFHTCLAPFYLATEMRTIKVFLFVTLVTEGPYPFVWCLRPSGKNLGNLRSQVTISAVPKSGVILTPIQQKLP